VCVVKELKLRTNPLGKRAMIAIPLAILAFGATVALLLMALRTPPPRSPRASEATFVEVVIVHPSSDQRQISVFGTVQAHREVMLQPEVSGLAVAQHVDLIEGGVIAEGEVVLQIDPREYRLGVEQQRASLISAESALKLEQGRQVVAKQEWELLAPDIEVTPASKSLALREPYLEETRAAVLAARSNLERAELDLERTAIRAPFNALVLSEDVEVGQHLTSQKVVATLVDIDRFDVLVSVPAQFLPHVRLPRADGTSGARARVVQSLGNGDAALFEGRVTRLLGDVDPHGRMARVLIAVSDPMGLQTQAGAEPQRTPLLLGAYVRTEIEGEVVHDVYALPHRCLREGNHVWIMNGEQRLEIRSVEIISDREGFVLVRGELSDGDRVVTSALPVALPGMELRSTRKEAPGENPARNLAGGEGSQDRG